jgi:HSP20 family protein
MANLIRKDEGARPESLPSGWEPFKVMRDLMGWDPFAEMLPSVGREIGFTPRFEVKETKDAYVFKADLPGIEEKDLELTLTGNRLTVSGKREAEERRENETYYTWERSYGTFARSFTLPEGGDFGHAEAELKNGVLSIVVPKTPEHMPRKIALKSIGEKVRTVLGGKEKGST